jgi:hypothetical protein
VREASICLPVVAVTYGIAVKDVEIAECDVLSRPIDASSLAFAVRTIVTAIVLPSPAKTQVQRTTSLPLHH